MNSTRLSTPCQTVQNSLLDMWSIHGTALRALKSGTDFLTEHFQASVLPMTNFQQNTLIQGFCKAAAHSAVEKMVPGCFICSLRSFWVSTRSIFNLYLGGISTPQDGFSKSRQDVRRHWIVRFFVLMLWCPKTRWWWPRSSDYPSWRHVFLKTCDPTKPFAVISESFRSQQRSLSIDQSSPELKSSWTIIEDDLLIHVRGGFASNRYQKATNYDYLSDEAEKGRRVVRSTLFRQKNWRRRFVEHCIPIQLNPAEACSATTGVDSVTWGDLISLVEGNPNEFDSRVYRAYKGGNVTEWKGSSFCQEIAVLRCC